MALASWSSVSPLVTLIWPACRCPLAARSSPPKVRVLLLATDVVEYHEAVVADYSRLSHGCRLRRPIAVAVTRLESEESTSTDDNAPCKTIQRIRSFSTVVVSPLMFVSAASWLVIAVCCASHCVSGASAAVIAAFTAEVTSIASELEPVAASNSELRSTPFEVEGDVDEADPSNEAKSEVDRPTELIPHLSKPDYRNTMAELNSPAIVERIYCRSFRMV